MDRLRQGDPQAFEELVIAYQHRVFGVALRMLGSRAEAEEAAQEVFLRAHRAIADFRGDAKLSTWIFRIVQNVCSQARARRVPELPLERDGETGPRYEPGRTDAAFGEIELRDRLEKAIAQLPENYRLLIAAHYLKGVQYEALAETLDIPLGTVKTHLHRAKRRLRELLEG